MKNIKLYFRILALILMLSSCQKYLDIKRTNTQTPITSLEDCQKLLDNRVVMNENAYPSDGILSSDQYTVNDQQYNSDRGNQTERDLYTWRAFAIRPAADNQWQNTYQVVYYANVVLEYAEKLKSADAAKLNGIKGQALFFRAYAHWQVAQLYCKPYSASSAGQDPGIPLKLESDINDNPPRGTVQQTYDRILQDLNEAVNLLAPTSIVPTRPNKAAAHGMLARVYQSMEDYSQALSNATAALQLKNDLLNYNDLNTNNPFNFGSNYNKEIVFQSSISPTFFITPVNQSQPVALIDADVANAFAENDLRRVMLIRNNGDGTYRSVPGPSYNGLSVDELYFIRAESYARVGNASSAMNDLNTLLITRWKKVGEVTTYVPMTASTADEALGKVLEERRKGLLMRGLRWTDLRRLNKDSRFAKTLSRTVLGVTYTLPPNDPRYTLLIPQDVIQYGRIAQNER